MPVQVAVADVVDEAARPAAAGRSRTWYAGIVRPPAPAGRRPTRRRAPCRRSTRSSRSAARRGPTGVRCDVEALRRQRHEVGQPLRGARAPRGAAARTRIRAGAPRPRPARRSGAQPHRHAQAVARAVAVQQAARARATPRRRSAPGSSSGSCRSSGDGPAALEAPDDGAREDVAAVERVAAPQRRRRWRGRTAARAGCWGTTSTSSSATTAPARPAHDQPHEAADAARERGARDRERPPRRPAPARPRRRRPAGASPRARARRAGRVTSSVRFACSSARPSGGREHDGRVAVRRPRRGRAGASPRARPQRTRAESHPGMRARTSDRHDRDPRRPTLRGDSIVYVPGVPL